MAPKISKRSKTDDALIPDDALKLIESGSNVASLSPNIDMSNAKWVEMSSGELALMVDKKPAKFMVAGIFVDGHVGPTGDLDNKTFMTARIWATLQLLNEPDQFTSFTNWIKTLPNSPDDRSILESLNQHVMFSARLTAPDYILAKNGLNYVSDDIEGKLQFSLDAFNLAKKTSHNFGVPPVTTKPGKLQLGETTFVRRTVSLTDVPALMSGTNSIVTEDDFVVGSLVFVIFNPILRSASRSPSYFVNFSPVAFVLAPGPNLANLIQVPVKRSSTTPSPQKSVQTPLLLSDLL